MEIAIIGSGLSAWAVYESLRQRNIEGDTVTIIDSGLRFGANSSDKRLLAGQKKKFGSTHMYESLNSDIVFTEPSNFSMANGGLSTVWGAGIRLWPQECLAKISRNPNAMYSAAKSLLESIPYAGDSKSLNIPEGFGVNERPWPPGSNHFDFLFRATGSRKLQIFRSGMAISVQGNSACRGCGECLTGCPYNSIFDAGVAFDFAVSEKKVNRITETVLKVVPDGKKVLLEFKATNSLSAREFDRVYLCAGAIGTPSILIRSGLVKDHLDVLDSQVFYFAGIKIPVRKKDSPAFALSQVTICHDSYSDSDFSASLYDSSEEIRDRISNMLSLRFFGLRIGLPKFLDRIIFLGIGFLDSSKSGRISLSKQDHEEIAVKAIANPESSHQIRKVLRLISRSLLGRGIFVIPWISIAPLPGGGFHSGGALPLDSEHVHADGSLRACPAVYIADTCILPFLRPGAHTFTSMALVSSLIRGN